MPKNWPWIRIKVGVFCPLTMIFVILRMSGQVTNSHSTLLAFSIARISVKKVHFFRHTITVSIVFYSVHCPLSWDLLAFLDTPIFFKFYFIPSIFKVPEATLEARLRAHQVSCFSSKAPQETDTLHLLGKTKENNITPWCRVWFFSHKGDGKNAQIARPEEYLFPGVVVAFVAGIEGVGLE